MRKYKKRPWKEEKPITKQNKTLDLFMHGLSDSQNSNSVGAKKIIPKIKVPTNSGVQPLLKPNCQKFIYPKNPEFRQYQYSICMKCVCYNTLVCLPTGLGKTHIASVLILNFSQWFPQGKIFFLAPTKPLVFQQKKSLRNFREYIKTDQIAQMNGSMHAKKRQTIYQQKKIFFCTPQTFENDLRHKRIDGNKVVFIIFDQAHRGVGNYSYCKIVELMENYKSGYRIVALSATPGNEQQKIQQVINNLHISKLQIREHSDPDVACYLFTKQIKEVIIKPTTIINRAEQILLNFLVKPYNHLIRTHLIDAYVIKNHSFYSIMMQFNQKIKYSSLTSKEKAGAYASLKFIKFILDARRSLRNQGYQTFKNKFLAEIEKHDQCYSNQQRKIKQKNGQQNEENIQEELLSDQTSASIAPSSKSKSITLGYGRKISRSTGIKELKQLFKKSSNMATHPKLERLKEMLEEFFLHMPVQKQSKVIIFVQFRATALEIKNYLNDSKHIRAQLFHGQSKSKVMSFDNDNSQIIQEISANEQYGQQSQSRQKSSETILYMNQKQQILLLKKFTKNQINTLISTSIGQQGLDIGEVDCIFCYDGGMSPIRMIQRMGRTGRKRHGKVFILLMQGKQYNDYIKANQRSKQMKQTLKLKANKFTYYGFNPTMLPQMSEIIVQIVQNVLASPLQDSESQTEKEKTSVKEKDQDQEQSNQQKAKTNQMIQLPKKTKTKKQIKKRKSKIKKQIVDNLQKQAQIFKQQQQMHKQQQKQQTPQNQQKISQNNLLVKTEQTTQNGVYQIIDKYFGQAQQKQIEQTQSIKQYEKKQQSISKSKIEVMPQTTVENFQHKQQHNNLNLQQINQFFSQHIFQQPPKANQTIEQKIQSNYSTKIQKNKLQLMSDMIDQLEIVQDNQKYERMFSLISSDNQNQEHNESKQNISEMNKQQNFIQDDNLSFDSDQILDRILDLFDEQQFDDFSN